VSSIDELPVCGGIGKLLKSRLSTQEYRNRTFKTKRYFQSRNVLCVFRDSQLIVD